MSEFLTGPQRVSTAAQRIGACPHLASHPYLVGDLVPSNDGAEIERLHFFGLTKVVTDEIAERLPKMVDKFPPYGLPEPYRTRDMAAPDWRAVTGLRLDGGDGSYLASLDRLRTVYGSKLIVHIYDELNDMQTNPGFKSAVAGLAGRSRPRHRGSTESPAELAYEVISAPALGNLDVIIGLTAVAPGVLESRLMRQPSHEEVVAALSKSRRLAILPSLLARSQFLPYLVGVTKGHKAQVRGWGFDFSQEKFDATGAAKDGLTVDYAGGISTITVPSYKLDRGEFGHAFSPDVILSAEQPDVQQTLQDVEARSAVLTCPSRKMISAIWRDVVLILDRERVFDPR